MKCATTDSRFIWDSDRRFYEALCVSWFAEFAGSGGCGLPTLSRNSGVKGWGTRNSCETHIFSRYGHPSLGSISVGTSDSYYKNDSTVNDAGAKLSHMEIRVRLQLIDSDDSNGVKLWAIAEGGSGRRWFKWYENRGTAILDAENMRLVEETQLSHSGSRYVQNVHRKLYDQLEIAEEVLNTHWHSAAPVHRRIDIQSSGIASESS